MNALWLLLISEFERCLSGAGAPNGDGAGVAARQKRIRALKSAVSVFGSSQIHALLENCNVSAEALTPASNRAIDAALAAILAATLAPDSDFDSVNKLAEIELFALKNIQQENAQMDQPVLERAAATYATARVSDVQIPAPDKTGVDARLSALFALEASQKCQQIERILLNLEHAPDRLELIVPLMRAAHSIKGAARAVQLESAVKLAHALEDRFSQAQKLGDDLDARLIELGLRCNDCINELAQAKPGAAQVAASVLREMEDYRPGEIAQRNAGSAEASADAAALDLPQQPSYIDSEGVEPILRIKASTMGEIINLSVTNLVNLDRLQPFAESQQRLRKRLGDMARALESLSSSDTPNHRRMREGQLETTQQIRQALLFARQDIARWIEEFGDYSRTAQALAERSYHTAAKTRLRPFSEICASYPRIVRDLAKQLQKQVNFNVLGAQIEVDRDVLEQLESPLLHLLRNALDHGIETPERRAAAGKAREGQLTLQLSYRAGLLQIELSDDGCGVDLDAVRAKLIAQGQPEALVLALATDELLERLFAPGFSTRSGVSEISGRGVGLDAARLAIVATGGTLQLKSEAGVGSRFSIVVPISRAVTRALVVKVANELYAFPLLRVEKVVRADAKDVLQVAGAEHLQIDGINTSLIGLAEHLELGSSESDPVLHVVVVKAQGSAKDRTQSKTEDIQLGFLVGAIIGEFDLLSKPMDPRLGRVADLGGFSSLPDGSPVIFIDVEDLMRNALNAPQFRRQTRSSSGSGAIISVKKRVLVADDSISVRELVRQLLKSQGYEVETAVDGLDAWNKLREASADLVVTDVDMPRMDGIELVRSIKQDNQFKNIPVVVVSYRDRPEDRLRGLEARADAYLTKSDFHEDRFLQVVHDLIGPAAGK